MASDTMMHKADQKSKKPIFKLESLSIAPSLNSSPNLFHKTQTLRTKKLNQKHEKKTKKTLKNTQKTEENPNSSFNLKQLAREKYREWLRASLNSLKTIKSFEKLENKKKSKK